MGIGGSKDEIEEEEENGGDDVKAVNHLQELRNPNLDVAEFTPNQALLHAAEHGDLVGIKLQLRNGADVNWSDQGPMGDKKDDPLYKNAIITGDYALHRAAQNGQVEAVDLIFLSDAKMENKDRLGSTALHRAVSYEQPEVVRRLLSLDADHMARNIIGNTPLHIAAYTGNLEIARTLLEHEKQSPQRMIVAKNAVGLTPMDYGKNKKPILELFEAVMKRGESVSAVHPRIEAGRASGDSKSKKDRDWPVPMGRLEKEQHDREKERERGESKESKEKDASPLASRRERGMSAGLSTPSATIRESKLQTQLSSAPLSGNALVSSLLSTHGSTASMKEHKDKDRDKVLSSGKIPSHSHHSIGVSSDVPG